jgi:hypothetical protein
MHMGRPVIWDVDAYGGGGYAMDSRHSWGVVQLLHTVKLVTESA